LVYCQLNNITFQYIKLLLLVCSLLIIAHYLYKKRFILVNKNIIRRERSLCLIYRSCLRLIRRLCLLYNLESFYRLGLLCSWMIFYRSSPNSLCLRLRLYWTLIRKIRIPSFRNYILEPRRWYLCEILWGVLPTELVSIYLIYKLLLSILKVHLCILVVELYTFKTWYQLLLLIFHLRCSWEWRGSVNQVICASTLYTCNTLNLM
jgi:hypothetical protein